MSSDCKRQRVPEGDQINNELIEDVILVVMWEVGGGGSPQTRGDPPGHAPSTWVSLAMPVIQATAHLRVTSCSP